MPDNRLSTRSIDATVSPTKRMRDVARVVRWDIVIPVLVFLFLVLGGVTTSSIGVSTLLVDPDHGVAAFGDPEIIRSDEYLTSTPIRIGWASMAGFENMNPLSANPNFTVQAPSGILSSVIFFEASAMLLGNLVPARILVAFYWWIPYLLVFLALPRIFKFVAGTRRSGWLAALLIVFSPVVAWWSGSILWIVGFVGAGAAAMINCVARFETHKYLSSAVWGAISVILLARTPFHYQPWMIVLAPIILLMVIIPLITNREHWRSRAVIIAVIAGASLGVFALSLLELREGFAAALGTVYPGGREAAGGPVDVWRLFGAPLLMNLESQNVVGTNPSEVSSSYLIIGIVSVIDVLTSNRLTSRTQRISWLVVAWGTAFWVIWAMMNFGRIGASIPLISMVPAERAAAVVGILATFLFAISSTWRRSDRTEQISQRDHLLAPTVAGVAGFAVTGYAGSMLRLQAIPTMSTFHILLSSLIVGMLSFALLRWSYSSFVKVLLVVSAFTVVFQVNPIQVGLGDIGESDLASALRDAGDTARQDGEVWATDSTSFDALLTANAVPSLSARQMSGPDYEEWERLDPGNKFENEWNRGGSFIEFVWSDIPAPHIHNAAPDVITVEISPCDLREVVPELAVIVSSEPLQFDCLTPTSTLPELSTEVSFGGHSYHLYEVQGSSTR